MLYPADGMRRYCSQNYLVTDQSKAETRVSDFGSAMEKRGFLKTSVDQNFSLKLWGENYEKPFFNSDDSWYTRNSDVKYRFITSIYYHPIFWPVSK